MAGRMAGRVALVTGGGGGIGEATGRLFVEEGAAVVLVDTDKVAVETAATGMTKAVPGARVLARPRPPCSASRAPSPSKKRPTSSA
jgi:2-hydroxycyclohexanecarboxyl-CoA dehydrogenase